jgi:3-carboxy-cis,cis-muconate cycloisomerase
VEWLSLPQMMILTSGALKHSIYVAKNLQVDESAMRDNIGRADDVILAEAAVFALASVMPRTEAEEYVKAAVGIALSEGRSVIEVVRETTRRRVPKGKVDWRALARPENYLGESDKLIDIVVNQAKRSFS